jgi:hypothetical protein
MAAPIPEKEPQVIVSGSTVSWTKDLSDYRPDDGWTLTYALTISGAKIAITASDNGDGRHAVTVAASVTALWGAGRYSWQSYVTKDTERYSIGSGLVEIKPNLAAQTGGYDARTHARKMLDAIEAALEGRASADQLHVLRVTLGERDIQYNPEVLLPLRDRYRAEVAGEEAAAGLGMSGRVLVRL